MTEGPWKYWSTGQHVDEVQRLAKETGSRTTVQDAIAMGQTHAILALVSVIEELNVTIQRGRGSQ